MPPHPVIPLQRIEAARAVADSCEHYGFCTAVCPTYVLDGEENDSPRGRIALMKAMLDHQARPDPATMLHMDRCLSCLSCATTCAAGVDYRQLADTAREYIEASGARPLPDRLYRWTLKTVLTSPRLLRAAVAASAPLKRQLARLPGRAGALGRLAGAPGASAFRERRSGSAEPQPAQSGGRAVALLDGCVQSVLGAEINAATRRVLARAGVRVAEAPPELRSACCGAMHLHTGDRQGAERRAARLVDHWAAQLASGAIDAIVLTTSGCGSVVRHYDELFDNDPPRKEKARAVVRASVDISVLLAGIDLPATGRGAGARVAYHDACSLRHGQKLTRPPRKVLQGLGFEVCDIPEAHLCCGSAGVYNLLQPAIADRLGQRKAGNIAGTAPQVVVAGNLGCLVQISRFAETPVAHLVQLVDWAGGGPAPRGLEDFQPRPAAAPTDDGPGLYADTAEAPAQDLSPNQPLW